MSSLISVYPMRVLQNFSRVNSRISSIYVTSFISRNTRSWLRFLLSVCYDSFWSKCSKTFQAVMQKYMYLFYPTCLFSLSCKIVLLQDSSASILIIVNIFVFFSLLRVSNSQQYRNTPVKNIINASFTSCFTLSIPASSSNVKIQSRYRTQASLCTTTWCNQHIRRGFCTLQRIFFFLVTLQPSHHRYDLISSRGKRDAWETIYQTDVSVSSFLRFLRSADRQAGRILWHEKRTRDTRVERATNAPERIGQSREARPIDSVVGSSRHPPWTALFFIRCPWGVLTDLDVSRSNQSRLLCLHCRPYKDRPVSSLGGIFVCINLTSFVCTCVNVSRTFIERMISDVVANKLWISGSIRILHRLWKIMR